MGKQSLGAGDQFHDHVAHTQAGMASGITAPTSSCGGSRNLKHFIKRQWELAGQLVEKTQQLKQNGHIHGIQRIERKLSAERAFLESVRIPTCLFCDSNSQSFTIHIQ